MSGETLTDCWTVGICRQEVLVAGARAPSGERLGGRRSTIQAWIDLVPRALPASPPSSPSNPRRWRHIPEQYLTPVYPRPDCRCSPHTVPCLWALDTASHKDALGNQQLNTRP